MTKLDEFKAFVKKHPKLRNDVLSKKRTWQDIYEDWVLFSDDKMWDKYIDEPEEEKKETSPNLKNDDTLKNILGYVKKVNPDTITKYVSSIQKIIELLSSFGVGATTASISKKKTTDPLFDRSFDEWY